MTLLAAGRRFGVGGFWRTIRPRSLNALILIGILAVSLPLAAGFLVSSLQVQRLAKHGHQAVYQSVRTNQEVRVLVNQISAMERAARQYSLTQDAARFDSYQELRTDWRKRVERQLEIDNRGHYAELLDTEHAVFDVLSQATTADESNDKRLSLSALEQLSTLADELRTQLTSSAARVDAEVDVMNAMATNARTLLSGVGVAVSVVAFVLATIFYLGITRSLRQLDRAITRLGDGDFAARIDIVGPGDLESLGRRLEWLRVRLRDLESQKSSFLRNMSHELKTPLTALREGSDLLAQTVLGNLNAPQQEVADILRESSLRLERDIEQLLEFSRLPGAGPREVSPSLVQINEVITSVMQDYQLSCTRKSLALTSKLESIEISADRQKIRTVIDNLVSNAVKYTPARGQINIAASRDEKHVVVEVADSGSGVEEGERERIFEAFYQTRQQPRGSVRGSGIGLSIARECAKLHGGDIEISDSALGGACFRLWLPVAS
ncbi:MAG: HAMP domain-containing sensor histidine kinase [Pseudomonadota bacterium]